MSGRDQEIVGHKTFGDGKGGFFHEPLTRAEAASIREHVAAAKAKRAADMPTDQAAIHELWRVWYRLEELGWKAAHLAPSDTEVQTIELGSSGIHLSKRDQENRWWTSFDNDAWPTSPILFKPRDPTP